MTTLLNNLADRLGSPAATAKLSSPNNSNNKAGPLFLPGLPMLALEGGSLELPSLARAIGALPDRLGDSKSRASPSLSPSASPSSLPISVLHDPTPLPMEAKVAVMKASDALLQGVKPQPIAEGMSGSYLVRDRRNNAIAVFKPSDEEPCAPNNPKGLSGQLGDTSIKKGVRAGEQALREVAAFLLDHDGLAKVPPTLLVSLASPSFSSGAGSKKEGSFQLFRRSVCTSGDMGWGMFDAAELQAIAALDLRLVNADRHDGNILVQEHHDHHTHATTRSLVPIDHGCCLPDSLRVSCFEWAWLDAPALRQPIAPAVRASLLGVDVAADARVLRRLGIRDECVRSMVVATTFVQTCVRRFPNMTLRDIAVLMCREDDSVPSPLERAVMRLRWRAAARVAHSTSNNADADADDDNHNNKHTRQCFEQALAQGLPRAIDELLASAR